MNISFSLEYTRRHSWTQTQNSNTHTRTASIHVLWDLKQKSGSLRNGTLRNAIDSSKNQAHEDATCSSGGVFFFLSLLLSGRSIRMSKRHLPGDSHVYSATCPSMESAVPSAFLRHQSYFRECREHSKWKSSRSFQTPSCEYCQIPGGHARLKHDSLFFCRFHNIPAVLESTTTTIGSLV